MRCAQCVILIGIAWCTAFVPAHAQVLGEEGMGFDEYFRLLAEEIRFFLDAERKGDKTVAVAFQGPPTWKTSGSNRLIEELKAQLAVHKIKIDSPANYAFKGEYKMTRSGRLFITGNLVDRLGDVPKTWLPMPPCLDPDPKLLAAVMGLSTDLTPRKGMEAVEELKRSLLNPAIALTGTENVTARTTALSPFGVRVLVDKRPKKLSSKAGQAFVDLDLDDTFELEIVNDAPYEVASTVAVDGLSVFHFSELRKEKKSGPNRLTEPRFRYYIFAGRSSGLVQGWEKNDRTVRAFKIVPFEECAAVTSGQSTDVGMITVSFHASWEKNRTAPPRDEDRTEVDDAVGVTKYKKTLAPQPNGTTKWVWDPIREVVQGTKLGTGFGQDILVSSQGVEREIGATRGLVTIRYARKDSNAKRP